MERDDTYDIAHCSPILSSWTVNIAPRPDMLNVIVRSTGQGWRAGLVSALGIATGSVIRTYIVAPRLASLVAVVPLASDLVTCVGAGFLISPGTRALLNRQH
jgi:threonine/homoserine/homoserine lactone efflux protein